MANQSWKAYLTALLTGVVWSSQNPLLNLLAQDQLGESPALAPFIAPASDEAQTAIKRFQGSPGLKVDLWAAEPQLANPVTFWIDEKGRVFVCETFRLGAGVDDIRGIMDWLDEELAARTVDDREAEMKRHLGDRFASYRDRTERIRLLEDTTGQGKADRSTVFAEQFNTPLDGIAAGILARKGSVWYANIPNLWLLQDTNSDRVADVRTSLHYGFGVRVGFLGHDLHGPRFGPDGKLYFSVGDRGSNVRVRPGTNVGNPDTGCVFRCNPDGTELEVFAYGLRNPQDLVFDEYGNLFTGDNNSDSGDQARWVYLVEGGDSGWRVGYQFMESPYSRGPFNAEKLWYPAFPGQAANIVPPIANIASGPSGIAYFPGTGLVDRYAGHFFLADFRGGPANSGLLTFTLKQRGAGFEASKPEHFLWNILATDAKFAPDGGLYVTDWVQGWGMPGKGRIYRIHSPEQDRSPVIAETKKLLSEGFSSRETRELIRLLAHSDMRVRQEAQFELAERGTSAVPEIQTVLLSPEHQLARLHSIWALGQISAQFADLSVVRPLIPLLDDADGEVRAQAARVLGDRKCQDARAGLLRRLEDPAPRARFFAALALGKLHEKSAQAAIVSMLANNADRDPYIRHAGVMALAGIGHVESLADLARHESRSVRLASLLALRRLQRPEVVKFLGDSDRGVVLEAARAINDEPINGGIADLANLLQSSRLAQILQEPDVQLSAPKSDSPAWFSSEALLRRVLNANFHFGTARSAKELALFAARTDVPENMRVEALEELAQWEHPSGRDRVVGLWRPVAGARRIEHATESLTPLIGSMLSAPDSVRLAALRTVGQLKIANAEPLVLPLALSTNLSGRVRAEALQTLAMLNSPNLSSTLEMARNDSSETVRIAATRVESRMHSSNLVARLATTLETGTFREQQAALSAVSDLTDPAADALIGDWLDRFGRHQVPREVQLDVLLAAGKRTARSVVKKLEKIESARSTADPLAEFQETLYGGSADAGRKIFFERPDAQCVRCHKISGQGGDVGPDLTHVSAQRDRHYLLESIVTPNSQITEGFNSVLVNLKDGNTSAGVLKSETDSTLTLVSADSGAVTIKKSDIESRQSALSPMPEGFGLILPKADLRNLIEFLSQLK